MDSCLVSIAAGNTGNQLVLKSVSGLLKETIYLWDHETNRAHIWGKDFDYLLVKAQARIAKIEKQVAKSMNRNKRRA